MGRTRNAHKKRLLERQKTTESAFYRRGHEGLRPLKRVVCYKDADDAGAARRDAESCKHYLFTKGRRRAGDDTDK